jgi:hypothetical protein
MGKAEKEILIQCNARSEDMLCYPVLSNDDLFHRLTNNKVARNILPVIIATACFYVIKKLKLNQGLYGY